MKLKKLFLSLILVFGIGIFTINTNVNASSNNFNLPIPKKMQHTYYAHGKHYKITKRFVYISSNIAKGTDKCIVSNFGKGQFRVFEPKNEPFNIKYVNNHKIKLIYTGYPHNKISYAYK